MRPKSTPHRSPIVGVTRRRRRRFGSRALVTSLFGSRRARNEFVLAVAALGTICFGSRKPVTRFFGSRKPVTSLFGSRKLVTRFFGSRKLRLAPQGYLPWTPPTDRLDL